VTKLERVWTNTNFVRCSNVPPLFQSLSNMLSNRTPSTQATRYTPNCCCILSLLNPWSIQCIIWAQEVPHKWFTTWPTQLNHASIVCISYKRHYQISSSNYFSLTFPCLPYYIVGHYADRFAKFLARFQVWYLYITILQLLFKFIMSLDVLSFVYY